MLVVCAYSHDWLHIKMASSDVKEGTGQPVNVNFSKLLTAKQAAISTRIYKDTGYRCL